MNILVAGNYYYPQHAGGVEIVSYNLIKHYRKNGHSVRWVAADVPPNFRDKSEYDVPIRAWNITEEKLGFPHPIPYPDALIKLYKNTKWCDVVHLQDSLYPINILIFAIAKILKKPVLITQYAKVIPYRQFYKRILQTLAYRTIGWLMFSAANRVVFITTNVRDNMNYITPKIKHDVVPLGVDTDLYFPVSAHERNILRKKISGDSLIPLILFVGRMVERKGINLIHPLIEKYKEWHWVLVGRPDDFNPGDWNLSNLTYLQNTAEDKLRELYAAADILVHPSVGEGITLIVSESMACGTPVIISEESLHEIDAFDRELFFPVLPETSQIGKALENALHNIYYLDSQRPKVREYALKRLSWQKVAEQYLSILSELSGKMV